MSGHPWTPTEDAALLALGREAHWTALLAAVPGRTRPAVMARHRKLCGRKGNRPDWTPAEDRVLTMHLGEPLSMVLAKLPGRSADSIRGRARRLLGVTTIVPGTVALATLARRTGYDREMLLRARKALGQKWRRDGSGRAPVNRKRSFWRITEEQADALVEYLATEQKPWAKKHDRCVWCGTTERRHRGRGACEGCIFRDPALRAAQLARQARWRAKRRLTPLQPDPTPTPPAREGLAWREP